MSALRQIRVVLVLYKLQLENSPAYQSLKKSLDVSVGLAAAMHLLVCDNSPTACQPAADFRGEYHHDASNPGLARSYNLALKRAVDAGDTWLMLLDQDTVVTSEYLSEIFVLADRYAADLQVVAAVPKLIQNNIVQSPHTDLTTKDPRPLSHTYSGFPEQKLHMYNSGALIRASSLQTIGGFPEAFWLDFLDHATFHLLRKDGGKVFVMQSALQHELSTNAPAKPQNKAYLSRHQNVLEAEFRFYHTYGTARERWWYRRRLILTGLRAALRHRLFRIGWRTLMVARRVQVGDA